MLSQTNEQAFEYLIEKALVGSTVEERKEQIEKICIQNRVQDRPQDRS